MTILEDLWYGNINPHETILRDFFRYCVNLRDGIK